MPRIEMNWEILRKGQQGLYLGDHPNPVAIITKANKYWSAEIYLGEYCIEDYHPANKLRDAIETLIERFFSQALSPRQDI